ncbi:hypothetical protein ACFYPT_35825 [Streptomyces sp. NPDC005529]|uniref:hypothetical protein n=1 Tax=unclassified Streptomyces TaxID=2593676 RepID=UPI0033ABCDF1
MDERTSKPADRRPRVPMKDIDVAAATRNAGRLVDIPGQRPARTVTFDSAL